jgi:hypothetical protein
MTTSKKINKLPYQHVRITWWDIQQSNEAWIDEDDVLKNDIAVCQDTGYIFKKTKDKLWLMIRSYLLVDLLCSLLRQLKK